jgi:MinD superfamily P-loop ATPase containing an inserted ferredoxin domain
MKAMEHQYLKNVVTLDLEREKCIGCGKCVEVCPHNVFTMEAQKAGIQDRDACMECGACARNCPVQAVTVKAGVGCAYAILLGKLRGTEPTCGCGDAEEGGPSCCG